MIRLKIAVEDSFSVLLDEDEIGKFYKPGFMSNPVGQVELTGATYHLSKSGFLREWYRATGPTGIKAQARSRKICLLPLGLPDYVIEEGDHSYSLACFPTSNVARDLGMDTGPSESAWWGDGFRLAGDRSRSAISFPRLGPPD